MRTAVCDENQTTGGSVQERAAESLVVRSILLFRVVTIVFWFKLGSLSALNNIQDYSFLVQCIFSLIG